MNKLPLPVSQEILNAFVDDEIEAEERDCIIEMESENQDIANAICELRRLKELVKAARESEPVKLAYLPVIKKQKREIKYTVASIVIVLAVSIFFIPLNKQTDSIYSSGLSFAPESMYQNSASLLTAASNNKNMNLVLHLKSSEPKQAVELLHLLESVLQNSTILSHGLHVEVIVSGPGLHFLQKDSSTYTSKINTIANKYHNITFIACGKTVQRLQVKTNKKVQIINDAMLVVSGPKWVEQRRKKGWTYILI